MFSVKRSLVWGVGTLTLDVEDGAQVVIVHQVQLGSDHIQVLYILNSMNHALGDIF
jgi:hypothetical protein